MNTKQLIGSIRSWVGKDASVPIKESSPMPDPMISRPGDSELIDELTDKLLEVEIKLASAQLQSRHDVAQSIVKTHMLAGSSMALLPVPIFDLASLTGTQLSLLKSLSTHYGVGFDEQRGKMLLTSLISGSIPLLTVIGLSSFAKLIPGIGSIGGGISMTVLTSALVYATGQVFIRHFEQGGTLENFQSKYWRNVFTQQLEAKKITIKSSDVNTGDDHNPKD